MEPTRPTKRERTRAALIDAASRLIGEHGFEGTSLEAVARAAGMSRGAIYGNFADREELFMGVVLRAWPLPPSPFQPGAPFREQMRRLGQSVAAMARERSRMAIGAASFRLYALTHETMRQHVLAENRRIYRYLTEALLAEIPESQLPMPVALFIPVLHALQDGLMFGHFLTPELITEQMIVAAFEALAGPGVELGHTLLEAAASRAP